MTNKCYHETGTNQSIDEIEFTNVKPRGVRGYTKENPCFTMLVKRLCLKEDDSDVVGLVLQVVSFAANQYQLM